MDTLHTMLRALGRERKSEATRITTFRSLVAQLEQAARPAARRPSAGKRVKASTKRGRKA
jgi:hypothetical protein